MGYTALRLCAGYRLLRDTVLLRAKTPFGRSRAFGHSLTPASLLRKGPLSSVCPVEWWWLEGGFGGPGNGHSGIFTFWFLLREPDRLTGVCL